MSTGEEAEVEGSGVGGGWGVGCWVIVRDGERGGAKDAMERLEECGGGLVGAARIRDSLRLSR